MQFLWKCLYFLIGGGAYTLIELLWRGRSHYSMFCLGGICFLVLGQLTRLRLPLPVLAIPGAAIVTALELLTGLLVNRQYAVWDYRAMPLNFRGQICLPFSLLWIPLCWIAMVIYGKLSQLLNIQK